MHARVWSLLNRLTPLQRAVLGDIGVPRWCGDAMALWQPLSRQEARVVRHLCRVGIVEAVGHGEYVLTALGETVAAQVRPRR